ncbi:metallophosphoesterase [Robertmurraya andreesenii]|uniref:MPP superfamily phosphohydrolase n=1 Tax=Anoxybacillus andreesenii TaxID=1325932 RepID=A0ABT9V4G5_9BACL|nr:metallophosphoesterase [Robertmurraya andreesenii]MDQ0155832.1 putative MPP superfamily phosphohydrolase [Robertmurraya andreesenii]
MPKKVSRRSFLKRFMGTILTTLGVSTGGYVYAGKIEPILLKINNHKLVHSNIPSSFDEFKIVQFSDTHLGFQYTLEQLAKLVEKINSIQPDILFFTGDLLDAPNQYREIDQTISILKKLHAPFGKFAVYGNHDHGGYGTDLYRDIIEKAGFTLLLNESTRIQMNEKEHIYVIGIDDAMLGRPDLQAAISEVPDDAYKILLSHAPDLADYATNFNIQVQLSGHSHGGQIQLPFIGALVKPPFAEKYFEGFYRIGSTNPLTLYVNRGLGTTRLPFRFLSVPELTVFTLKQEKAAE